jgi:predicted ArsR family transcriptional regulator
MTGPAPSILHLDREAIKVLAHPLRSRLLTELRMHGPATATDLARGLDTNTGATSYHLRRLASVGLVEETQDGRGRERPWRAATEMHGWTERDTAGDPDAEAASDWLRHHYLRTFVERYEAWLDDQAAWPLVWQDAAGASDVALNLDAAGLAALNADLEALFQTYRDRLPSGPADARLVQVHVHAFPLERSRA